MQRTINFLGTAQTNYTDWGTTINKNYPTHSLKFQIDGSVVRVLHEGKEVAHFDFETALGSVEFDDEQRVDDGYVEMRNYEKFDIDSMLTR